MFIAYKGSSFTNFETEYTFYLLPDPTIENDASSTYIPIYFDTSSGGAYPTFYSTAIANNINFIQSFQLTYSFTQQEAFSSSGPVKMPNLISITFGSQIVNGNATIKVYDLQLDAPGSIYFIARQIAIIQTDPQDPYSVTQIPVRISSQPSTQQIYNCQDWNGQEADACAKAVVANNNPVELLLKNLLPNSLYLVAFSTANEYPTSAVFSNNVETVEVQTSGSRIISFSLSFIIMYLFMNFKIF